MMDEEQERLEAALRRTPPATVPTELMERLRAATAAEPAPRIAPRIAPRRALRWTDWFAGWRAMAWATPVAAMVIIWLTAANSAVDKGSAAPAIAQPNAVQVGHSLVASFDEVAQMPGGEPVRFHCREWQDDVVIHDDAHGVVVSQSTPRVEMIPVRFEVY